VKQAVQRTGTRAASTCRPGIIFRGRLLLVLESASDQALRLLAADRDARTTATRRRRRRHIPKDDGIDPAEGAGAPRDPSVADRRHGVSAGPACPGCTGGERE
jgi:hypothetical protein